VARLVGPDPRQLIVNELIGPLDTSARDAAIARASGSGPIAYVGTGGEHRGARESEVAIEKERELDGYRLYGVVWKSGEGIPLQGVFVARRLEGGDWQVGAGHWGGGDPLRGRPWANLGRGGEPLYFGGRVCEAPDAARVRITSGARSFEDDVDATRWVLFPTDLPNTSMGDEWVVEIMRGDGEVIARHGMGGRSEPV
jgi:hypothetical protein